MPYRMLPFWSGKLSVCAIGLFADSGVQRRSRLCQLQVILRLLQPDFKIKTVFTIVRAKPGVSAASRLPPSLQPFLSPSASHQSPRLIALEGDCAVANLGLSAEDLRLLDNVSVVIHAAASTKFSQPLPYMLDTVVSLRCGFLSLMLTAMQTLLSYQMARFTLARPSVKCHIDVSSCFVGFNRPEGSVVPEAPLPPSGHEHANACKSKSFLLSEGCL